MVTRKVDRQRSRRLAEELRWYLVHVSSCCACHYEEPGQEFSRAFMAKSEIDVYLANPLARHPVRIPRRFWRELGRVVEPRSKS
jgi:hypothetical protein